MKLGLSTWAYTWSIGWAGKTPARPLDGMSFLETAAGLGARVVQFADNLPLHAMTPAARASLKSRADALGISVEVGTYGIDDETIDTYLAIARDFGSPFLRTVTGIDKERPDRDGLVARLRSIVPRLEKARIVLAVENHDLFSAATLAEIIQGIGSPYVGICLDTSNSFRALETPGYVIDDLGPLAVNVHLKDIEVVRIPGHDLGVIIQGAEPGTGQLDIPGLLKKLHGFGRDPTIILEQWVPPEPGIEETVAKEKAWAARGFRRLKKIVPD
jgi:3-oxoisoapionate decarboxylase